MLASYKKSRTDVSAIAHDIPHTVYVPRNSVFHEMLSSRPSSNPAYVALAVDPSTLPCVDIDACCLISVVFV